MCLEHSITFGRMARESDYLLAWALVLPPYASAHCTANVAADEGSGASRQQLPEQVVCVRGECRAPEAAERASALPDDEAIAQSQVSFLAGAALTMSRKTVIREVCRLRRRAKLR